MSIHRSIVGFGMVVGLGLPCLAHAERTTPSGLPVPRYVTLKFNEVNARSGPGDDYRLLWIYRAAGLPVQVVAENSEWRRICDPEGGLAWVHRRTTDGGTVVMRNAAAALALHRGPRMSSAISAYLAPRGLAELDRCTDKGWCKIKVGGITAWAPANQLWGTNPVPQCR